MMSQTNKDELSIMHTRLEKLENLLEDIALIADGHKSSRLYVDGENVALVSIRNMANLAIGRKASVVIGPTTTW
jgi:hypothetical protein